MKKSNLIGILVLMSFLLALYGCGGKSAADTAPEEETVVEQDDAGMLEEGVTDAGTDVTEEEVTDETLPEPDTETAEETEVAEASAEETAEEAAQGTEVTESVNVTQKTAQNYKVVSLKDLKAYPEEMNIKVGTTVEWRNVNDNLQHIIGWNGQKSAGIKPEPIRQGESWSYTFTTPGKIVWFSTARPTIQGTIYVEE